MFLKRIVFQSASLSRDDAVDLYMGLSGFEYRVVQFMFCFLFTKRILGVVSSPSFVGETDYPGSFSSCFSLQKNTR